jgi:NAD(P)-dependent dehydrogenase (short-subunit alcohol dehydrogenase family)/acyl carrier protein
VLVEVIAEKTGYPAETLDLDMALDADLGIDSIKRVEILSALQERLPEAPLVKPEHLGTLHNLRQIVAFLANGQAEAPAPASAPVGQASWLVPRVAETNDVSRVLVEVISEKTGYPAEMLDLDMALDTDLGIDSIKRVEILSALQERLPEAPIVKPEHLGTLHNLRQIVAFLANGNGNGEMSPAAGDASPHPPPTLERSVLEASPFERRQPRPAVQLTPEAEICLTAADDELSMLVLERLQARGLRARRACWLEAANGELPRRLGGLIFLAPRDGFCDQHLRAAVLTAKRAAAALRRTGGFLVTVSRLDGAFGLLNLDPAREPLDGALAGLAKTAHREWPEVAAKAIDLARDHPDLARAAADLVEECLHVGPLEIGLDAGGARTLNRVVRPQPVIAGQPPFDRSDLVVMTGGARGVTAEAAVALARACRPTIVLLGRTPLPGPEPAWLEPLGAEAEIKRALAARANGSANPRQLGEEYRHIAAGREVRQTLARLEAAGARAIYCSVDVRDLAAVAEALAPLRREFGPVRCVVHGAGVLADARIEDKTADQLDRVFDAKIAGLRSLLACLPGADLRALVLFSSTTARVGRAGQVDYAMANEALNKMARQQVRRLPHCRVVAINWGPWDGGMVTAGLKQLFAREGIGLIEPEAGGEFVVRELAARTSDVEVIVTAGPLPDDPPRATAVPAVAEPASTFASLLAPAFEREVSLDECPVLAAHVLDGRPVVPLALTLEWLAHAALHRNPGLAFVGVNDLRVLQGVKLERAESEIVTAAAGLGVSRDGVFVSPVELRGRRGEHEVVHARAEIVLAESMPVAPPAQPLPSGPSWPAEAGAIYNDLLFHGPDLHAIECVELCGPAGIIGVARRAAAPAAWIRRPLRTHWLADPLVIDAAFQLMVLWSWRQQGSPGLPCFVRGYRQFRRAFPDEPIRIACRVIRAAPAQAVADIDFLDVSGRLVARMEGYEAAVDAGLVRAYRRNRILDAVAQSAV